MRGSHHFGRRYKRGQTMIEYALVVSLIAVAVLSGYRHMGGDLFALVSSANALL